MGQRTASAVTTVLYLVEWCTVHGGIWPNEYSSSTIVLQDGGPPHLGRCVERRPEADAAERLETSPTVTATD